MSLLTRRATGALLALLGIALPPVAAAATMLAVAAVTDAPPLFLGAAALVLAASAYGLARAAARLVLAPRRRTAAALLAGVAWIGVAAAVVLPAGPHPAAGAVPAQVRFWSLPTGSRIAYVHAAAATGGAREPVVFLHGGPGTPGEGLPSVTAALVAAGFDVYAYDQLGAGRSNRLSDVNGYTVARHVADLEAIRIQLGVERLILVGQSWGASLAAQYLAAHPAAVRAVVFTGPGPIWPGAGHAIAANQPDRYRELLITFLGTLR
ncbi:alpha/beta hydrolase [Dactylosporangium matsuzakiense]|uniref:alpha/beta hydrolase n=1 Tax=Dactylosporangium matsuzakiense TaxID=53360 RepID=UPI0021C2B94E|nr:alpha/beta hydrolase [Dactylosporangium matsuzakiense]UWZ47779.1 alpha/beta fold hydrolase [Dactylosporangium matsuzakiense]